ncbi:MAG: hypothetical protein IJU82_04925 [Ruminiclostridium sp.]|nr:hypothetical protein [Ruminiclostridium sp.]
MKKITAYITALIISATALPAFAADSHAEGFCPYRVFYEENGRTLREYYASCGENYKPFSVLYLGGITSKLHEKYMNGAKRGEPFSVEIVFPTDEGGLYFYTTCEMKSGTPVQKAGAYTDGDYNIGIVASAEPFEKDGEMLYAFTIYREGLDDELTEAVTKAKSVIASAESCTVEVRSGDSFEDAYGHVGEYTAPVTGYTAADVSTLIRDEIGDRPFKGKAVKPAVKVRDVLFELKEGTDYTLSYKDNSAIGTASVTLNGIGGYTGSVSVAFDIVPRKSTLTALRDGNGVRLNWSRAKGAEKYVIYVSDDDGKTYRRLGKVSSDKRTCFLRLPPDNDLLFRIRSYKTVGGKKYYSEFSDEAVVEIS